MYFLKLEWILFYLIYYLCLTVEPPGLGEDAGPGEELPFPAVVALAETVIFAI